MSRRVTRRSSAEAAAASASELVTAALASPVLQANLFPQLHSVDIFRLSLTCTSLRGIVDVPEFAERVLVDVGPVKQLLARARAVILGDTASPDVWLWQTPKDSEYTGSEIGLSEAQHCGVDGRWARGLVDFLEGDVGYLIEREDRELDAIGKPEIPDVSEWEEDTPIRTRSRARCRPTRARSRAGTLKRIAALEREPAHRILKNVWTALHQSYCYDRSDSARQRRAAAAASGLSALVSDRQQAWLRMRRLLHAWHHCVRYGLDGLLPWIHKAGSPLAVTPIEVPGVPPIKFPIDSVFPRPRGGIPRNALALGAYLGHSNVMSTVVRLGATCSWNDGGLAFIAFFTALGHNRRDIVQRLCTSRASGGCGLSLAEIPCCRTHLYATSPRALLWNALMEDFERKQYQRLWLGPDFDPDELVHESQESRSRIRKGLVWLQTVAMLKLLIECGLPRRLFVPAVSDELLAGLRAGVSSREMQAFQRFQKGRDEYNSQFDFAGLEGKMLEQNQFKQLLFDLWPQGAAAGDDDEGGYESESDDGEATDQYSDAAGPWDDEWSDDMMSDDDWNDYDGPSDEEEV